MLSQAAEKLDVAASGNPVLSRKIENPAEPGFHDHPLLANKSPTRAAKGRSKRRRFQCRNRPRQPAPSAAAKPGLESPVLRKSRWPRGDLPSDLRERGLVVRQFNGIERECQTRRGAVIRRKSLGLVECKSFVVKRKDERGGRSEESDAALLGKEFSLRSHEPRDDSRDFFKTGKRGTRVDEIKERGFAPSQRVPQKSLGPHHRTQRLNDGPFGFAPLIGRGLKLLFSPQVAEQPTRPTCHRSQ